MSVTYRGSIVTAVEHNRADDTYLLIGNGDEVVAELKRHEYLSFPQLRSMRLSNGRHRGAGPKNKRSAARIASDPWGDDFASWLKPGAIFPYSGNTYSNAISSGPGLTATQIAQQMMAAQAARQYLGPSQMMQLLGAMERPKPALKRDGIIAGEIVGYRCWRVENGLLRSVYQNDIWKPGEVLEGRELGDWDSRGVHAWKDPASKEYHNYIRSYLNDMDDPFRWVLMRYTVEQPNRRPAMITGTVFLWGDVVEHERGWRAEFARVRSLDWLYPDETMMGREQQALSDLRAKYALSIGQRT